MRSLVLSRYALCSCVAAAMLAGCGGSQPPIGAPGGMPQSRGSAVPLAMKRRAILLAFLFVLAAPQRCLAQESVTRTASVPHLKVTASIERTGTGELMIAELFETDSPLAHTVICVSGLRDVKYILRNASGRIVPMANTENVYDGPPTGSGGVPIGPREPTPTPDPCKTIWDNVAQRKFIFSQLYPNLAHGTYTLRLILAPRGTVDQAALSPPFTISF
jgi:hypothetical protein